MCFVKFDDIFESFCLGIDKQVGEVPEVLLQLMNCTVSMSNRRVSKITYTELCQCDRRRRDSELTAMAKLQDTPQWHRQI